MNRKVAILGATGLIGSELLDILCSDSYFEHIKVIVRRPIDIVNPKVSVAVVDFYNEDQFRNALVDAEIIFCVVGTTLKKVGGDMDAYRKVDFEIPVNAARYGKENGCKHFAVVSSYGANSSKTNFYLKLKGEMEDALSDIKIPSLHIFRPSLLLGKRPERRFLEDIGQAIFPMLSPLFPSKAKPIKGSAVAMAMVESVKESTIDSHPKVYYYKDMMPL